MNADVMDEALDRFAMTGPEFGPGLSNHGPMAVDALIAMDRADAVSPWVDRYVRRLHEHPEARNPIPREDWREALGQIGRVGDWDAFFRIELDGAPWADVLQAWVPRLAPGIMAGATHGVIRTAHAVRSLERGTTSQRLNELAEALAYWAARYQELPGSPGGALTLTPADAIQRVERLDPSRRTAGLIFDAVRALDDDGFAPAINLVSPGDDADTFVSALTRTFVRHYLADAGSAAIGFIHSVTAPSAVRILAPHLTPATRELALRYVWQACASLYAAFGDTAAGQTPRFDEAIEFDEQDLIDEAVAARDEHAIKFTEACLREYRRSADPAFVAAARDAIGRLRRA